MTGFVIGVREVITDVVDRHMTADDGRKGAREIHRRVVRSYSPEVLRLPRGHVVDLGPSAGCCGPCGTAVGKRFLPDPLVARNPLWGASPIAWSLRMLWPQLVEHYSPCRPRSAPKLGAKTGPRGRKSAGDV